MILRIIYLGVMLGGIIACPAPPPDIPEPPEKTETPPPEEGIENGPCYANSTCNEGLVCTDDICVVEEVVDNTGKENGPCYPNGTCDGELVCENGICVQITEPPGPDQGALNGPCFPNDTCDEGLVCTNDICVEPDPEPEPEEGAEGGPCYGNGTCDVGLICTNDICGVDPTIGTNGGPCRADGTCDTGYVCHNDTCAAAGGSGELCFTDGTCDTGYVCHNDTCAAAGGSGELCFGDGTCDTGYVCSNDTCLAAGGAGELCFADNTCDTGNMCSEGLCMPAGGDNQPCMPDNTCDGDGVCFGGYCRQAGDSGQPCLADGTCAAGYSCINALCQSTGGDGQPCNSDGTCNTSLDCIAESICLLIVEELDCTNLSYDGETINCETTLGTPEGYCDFMYPPPDVVTYEGPSCATEACGTAYNYECVNDICLVACDTTYPCPNGYECDAGSCNKTVFGLVDWALIDACGTCDGQYYGPPAALEQCEIEELECTVATVLVDCGENYICEDSNCVIVVQELECTPENEAENCDEGYVCEYNECVEDEEDPPPPVVQSTCVQCHAPGGGYDQPNSIEDPHPWVSLECTSCHGGGDSTAGNPVYAHVCAPPEIRGGGQGPAQERYFETVDQRAFFLRNRLVGVDLLADYTCQNSDGTTRTVSPLEWLAFVNPGNLRVAQAVIEGTIANPVGCSTCHSNQAKQVIRSVMGQATGINSGTRHGIGVDNYYADRRGNLVNGTTDYNTMADYGAADIENTDYDAANRKVGEVSKLKRAQVFTGQNFLNNPNYTADQVNNSLNVNDANEDNYPNGVYGAIGAQLFQEVINQACTGCHLQSNYQNFRAGDYRTQGCSQCHFSTAVNGRSASADPNVKKYEPVNADALVPGEHSHRRDHRIRNVAKAPNFAEGQYQAVQGIDDFRCISCHNGSNRTVAQYYGYRLDQNQDLTNADFYPSNNTVTFTYRQDLFGENQTFNGRNLEQWIDQEIWQANGQDETPPDVHHEAGMGCIDCHGLGATHGPGKIYSRMKLQTHENDVLCQTCHGDIDNYAATGTDGLHIVDRAGNALSNTLVNPGYNYYLISKLDFSYHYIPQVKDIIDMSVTNNKINPDNNQPLQNKVASYAMGRYQQGNNELSDGYGPVQTDPNLLPATYSHMDGYLAGQGNGTEKQGLECYTCHSSWQNNCIGCHLDANYDGDPNNYFFSNVTGERIYFNFAANFVYQNPIHFMMGINDRAKISPYQGLHRFFSYTDLDNNTSNRVSYGDRNGLGNDPALRNNQRNNQPALQNQPFTPHSTRGRWTTTAVGMRGCLDCHLPNENAVTLVNQLGDQYNLRDIDGNGTDILADYDEAIYTNARMAWGVGSNLWQFDANGDPVYDDNNNAVYDLDRIVEEATGVTNTSSNHPLLDPNNANPDYVQTNDTNNAKVVRPLTSNVLQRLKALRLDTVYYYSNNPANDIQFWLRNYNYATQADNFADQ